MAEHKAEYSKLATVFGEGLESKTEMGVFSVLAEATVRLHIQEVIALYRKGNMLGTE